MSEHEQELQEFTEAPMPIGIGRDELVILPVDCEPKEWVAAVKEVPGVRAWPLPDGRVLVRRD